VRGVELPTKHVPIKLYSFKDEHMVSLFKLFQKSNNSNCQRIDILNRQGRQMILTTVYITGYWDTLPRIATSSRMFFRL